MRNHLLDFGRRLFTALKILAYTITKLNRLSEAPSHGKPINYYDRTSRGAEAYSNLANEFLKQNR